MSDLSGLNVLDLRKQYDRIGAQIEKKKTEVASLTEEHRSLEKELRTRYRQGEKTANRKIAVAEAEALRVRKEAESELEALTPFAPKTRKGRTPKSE